MKLYLSNTPPSSPYDVIWGKEIDGKINYFIYTSRGWKAAMLEDIKQYIDDIVENYTDSAIKETVTDKLGAQNGIATLNGTGKVPSSQLPSYVDDVVEYDSLSDFPEEGETGKIYIAKDTGLVYRWSGSEYFEISNKKQKQTDWNENDNTKEEFIKNKTHYIEDTSYPDVFEEGSGEIAYDSYYTCGYLDLGYSWEYPINADFDFSAYLLEINETIYECDVNGCERINSTVWRWSAKVDRGYMYIDCDDKRPSSNKLSLILDIYPTGTQVSVKFYKIVPDFTYHKLDNRFLNIDTIFDGTSENCQSGSALKTVFDTKIDKLPNYQNQLPVLTQEGNLVNSGKLVSDLENVQGDWNIYDENSKSYIQNRTHYIEAPDYRILIYTGEPLTSRTQEVTININPENGERYRLSFIDQGNVIRTATAQAVTQSGSVRALFGTECLWKDGSLKFNFKSSVFNTLTTATYTITKWDENPIYKPLDDNYISDNIARITDIPTHQLQSDWDQNNALSKDYIKNRTHWKTPSSVALETYSQISVTFSNQNNKAVVNLWGYNSYPQNFLTYLGTVDNYMQLTINGQTFAGFIKSPSEFSTMKYIGNLSLVNQGTEDTGEDWCICTNSLGFDSLHIVLPIDFIDETSIDFTFYSCEYHQINEKFIPNTIARVSDIPAQVQADWNQNDESAPDYIKNRICYSEISNVVLFENTVEFTIHQMNASVGTVELSNPFQFEEGKQYTVTKDGVEYVLTAQIVGETIPFPIIFYGNFGELENGSWMIGIEEGQIGIQECAETQLVSTTLKIVGAKETVSKIDEKFIPFEEQNVYDIYGPQPINSGNVQQFPGVKSNCFYDDINIVNSNNKIVLDFSGIKVSEFKKAYGIFETDSVFSVSFVDENGNDILNESSNLTSFESNRIYYYDFTLYKTSDGEKRIAAIFTAVGYTA